MRCHKKTITVIKKDKYNIFATYFGNVVKTEQSEKAKVKYKLLFFFPLFGLPKAIDQSKALIHNLYVILKATLTVLNLTETYFKNH